MSREFDESESVPSQMSWMSPEPESPNGKRYKALGTVGTGHKAAERETQKREKEREPGTQWNAENRDGIRSRAFLSPKTGIKQ